MVEFWRAAHPMAYCTVDQARAIEAEGWDGQMAMDLQTRSADPFILLSTICQATSSLRIATGVTNPFTRHPSVVANAMMTLNVLSGGRAVLGIGRGDSAMAYIGRAPMSTRAFERALIQIQSLLAGQDIEFDEDLSGTPPAESLELRVRPQSTRIAWVPEEFPKVPLDVAATGPRIISMAARIADRVTFSVGAQPERIQWAVGLARQARLEAGLDPMGVQLGAQVVLIAHNDLDRARTLAMSGVAPLARFQVLQGDLSGPPGAQDESIYQDIRRSYDMSAHGAARQPSERKVSKAVADFVDRFAIVGPAELCIRRILELVDLGIKHFQIVGIASEPLADESTRNLFMSTVVPAVRATLATRGSSAIRSL